MNYSLAFDFTPMRNDVQISMASYTVPANRMAYLQYNVGTCSVPNNSWVDPGVTVTTSSTCILIITEFLPWISKASTPVRDEYFLRDL